jgi:hypothetical protein
MTQNDPVMTQKLPSFEISGFCCERLGKTGQKLGHWLGHGFDINCPEINGSNARVLEETGRSGLWFVI